MARKKIYDVMPPDQARKVENTIKSLGDNPAMLGKEPKKKRAARAPKAKNLAKAEGILTGPSPSRQERVWPGKEMPVKARRRFPVKEILIGCLIVIGLFGIYFVSKLPKASIEIFPALEKRTLNEVVVADTAEKEVNVEKKVIPLQYFEEVKEAWQEFPSTGSASNSGKASGNMTIYNKLSPAIPLTLVSGTHFLSNSGKYFVTLAKVTIPAMKGKTPGFIEVKVQAEEVGSDYNIGPSTFSVPKLSGTSYYYGIWGETKEKMDGGYTGNVKKVTRNDLETAEDIVTEKLMKEAEEYLKNKITDGMVLLENSIISEVIETSATVKPDAIANNFTQSAKVKVSALVFAEKDVKAFVADSILAELGEGQNVLESSFQITYEADTIDFKKKTEKITIEATVDTYHNIDITNLPDLIKRKSADEAQKIVNSLYGGKVSEVQIHFWPFWVNKVPKNTQRIETTLKFD